MIGSSSNFILGDANHFVSVGMDLIDIRQSFLTSHPHWSHITDTHPTDTISDITPILYTFSEQHTHPSTTFSDNTHTLLTPSDNTPIPQPPSLTTHPHRRRFPSLTPPLTPHPHGASDCP
ncbi:hypothetical protein Pmani_000304 [Petrolisthes manimaculis]|uniref:Uncharacterized protein n=1 Tax=Petrolisthes manimaculis TaxID=1843537 RepID=A0AAE1QPG4_9EUCA|nr:hypothetical protein Pmani_000304 [Petrolisthes manimaculis]